MIFVKKRKIKNSSTTFFQKPCKVCKKKQSQKKFESFQNSTKFSVKSVKTNKKTNYLKKSISPSKYALTVLTIFLFVENPEFLVNFSCELVLFRKLFNASLLFREIKILITNSFTTFLFSSYRRQSNIYQNSQIFPVSE